MEPFVNRTEPIILAVLASGPAHGYDIHALLVRRLGRLWTLKPGRIYALLTGLEKRGLVDHVRVRQADRPDKKVFGLTEPGRRVVEAWCVSPVEHIRQLRLEFLAKLHFIGQVRPAGRRELVEAQVKVCAEKVFQLQQRAEAAEDSAERLTFSFRLAMARAALDWLSAQSLSPSTQ